MPKPVFADRKTGFPDLKTGFGDIKTGFKRFGDIKTGFKRPKNQFSLIEKTGFKFRFFRSQNQFWPLFGYRKTGF